MAPEDEPNTNPATAEPAPPTNGPREGRRPNRGHRGRGRRHKRKVPETERVPQQEQGGANPEREEAPAPEMASRELAQAAPEPPPEQASDEPVPFPAAPHEPNVSEPPANLQEAIDQVNRVVESLRESLEEMEEVLELLETLERQTSSDQREIDSLRRSLRQLHRPRESGREGGHGQGYSR